MMTAETFGTFAAKEAIKAGGPTPFDADGSCLLPDGPMDADWDALEDELMRKPTDVERRDFEDTYCRWMRAAIDDLTSDK